MLASDIQRVCCLLSAEQVGFYQDLLRVYRSHFGAEHVCWAPVPDFQLGDAATLCETILPFLASADEANARVVVHCSAGSGRTGHVLAAWLVFRYGMDPEYAAEMVVGTGPNPYEAEGRHDAGKRKLYALLEMCR